jgi:hypothetical protein
MTRASPFFAIGLAASLIGLPAAAAQPAHVEIQAGEVLYVSADGARMSVAQGGAKEGVLAPDGRLIAFVRGEGDQSGLWLYDLKTKATRLLLTAKADDTPQDNLTDFSEPHFSADGAAVYVMTAAWVTSDAVHRIPVDGGAQRFVAAGNALWVVRTGLFAGRLIVSQHMYHHPSGSYEQLWLLKANGDHALKIMGSKTDEEDPGPWLKRHGWRAD